MTKNTKQAPLIRMLVDMLSATNKERIVYKTIAIIFVVAFIVLLSVTIPMITKSATDKTLAFTNYDTERSVCYDRPHPHQKKDKRYSTHK